MTLTKLTKFAIAIGIQLLIIFAIIIFKISILTGGTTVFLKIEPVDPRDPLRGDYVTFRYLISRIDNYNLNLGSQINNFKIGDTIYVPLRQSGNYWVVTSGAQLKKPDNNQLYIKGKVTNSNDSYINVSYGIEQYFIPEGTGRGVRFTGSNNYAEVAIDENGNPALKKIYVDGKPWP